MRGFCSVGACASSSSTFRGAGNPYRAAQSIPAGLKAETIASSELLAPFQDAAEMHVAHGHNHISQFTHALIGVALGKRILESQ